MDLRLKEFEYLSQISSQQDLYFKTQWVEHPPNQNRVD